MTYYLVDIPTLSKVRFMTYPSASLTETFLPSLIATQHNDMVK